MIVKYIVLVIGTIFEVYTTNLYISCFLKKKSKKKLQQVAWFSFLLFFQAIASINLQGIGLLLCSFITALFICILYNSKWYVKFVLAITAVVINVASEMIASGVVMFSETVDFETINSDPYLFAIGTLLSKFIMFILVLMVSVSKFKISIDIVEFKHLLILSILPITTVSIIIIMYKVMFVITSAELKFMFVISSVFVVLSNVLTFYVINRQNSLAKAEYELNLLRESIRDQEKHYMLLQSSHEEIRQMKHNMKSMCLAVIAELKAGNSEKAIKQLNSNFNIIEKTNKIIDTGHPSIDTIIESKQKICSESSIDINIFYDYKEQINISEIEIAVILANILDNAIEACKQIDVENRRIWGILAVKNHQIVINIKNSSNKFTGFKTSKLDIKNHGYGLKSISHIAVKNNGYAKFDFKENEFTSYVVLENSTQ